MMNRSVCQRERKVVILSASFGKPHLWRTQLILATYSYPSFTTCSITRHNAMHVSICDAMLLERSHAGMFALGSDPLHRTNTHGIDNLPTFLFFNDVEVVPVARAVSAGLEVKGDAAKVVELLPLLARNVGAHVPR